ncbi:hypothetical protein ACN09C_14835 [Serratia fonticola]|uniref:hypothetical protein n=1 Tax=Serratia fonticola TaxID=47917 RepID=UPI003B003CE0
MTDKLEALSQPVAYDYQIAGACIADHPNPCGKWVGWRFELSRECPPDWMIEEGKVKDLKPRYSQEYVTALLAALEEKDQRIAELETIATDYAAKFQKSQDAFKYAAVMMDDDKKRIADLEQRLQQPIKLPLPEQQDITCVLLEKRKIVAAIKIAGFKVEGE